MNFLERAEILISRGIPVIPVNPRSKACTLADWHNRATVDREQIVAWSKQDPNFNTGALASLEGVCILDVDAPETCEHIRAEAGIDLAEVRTLRVQGKKPAPMGHNYFQHTDLSRRLGNRSQAVKDRATGNKVGTRFDFQADRKYVVGPGSNHPEGAVYTIVDDSPIIAIPDELVFWIEHNSEAAWIGDGPHGERQDSGGRAGRLDERALKIIERCAGFDRRDDSGKDYAQIKAIICEYGYEHRHEADLAIALYLFYKHSGQRELVADEFCRIKLHRSRGTRYDAVTLAKAERSYHKPQEWPLPTSITIELQPVEALDLELLPSSLRLLVADVAERMQVPADIPAAAAIVSLSASVGRRALIRPKVNDSSWEVVPNLWGLIIAPPGNLKTPTVQAVTEPLRRIEAGWRQEYAETLAEHEKQAALHKLDVQVWQEEYKRAKKKGCALPAALGEGPKEPTQRRLITTDATVEKLHELLCTNPAGVLVLRDELSGWLAELDKAGREGERGFYLTGWDGHSGYHVDRVGRGSLYTPHVCISFLGNIQPARLRCLLATSAGDEPVNDDGLIQRFQVMVWPDPLPCYEYIDRAPNRQAIATAEEVFQTLVKLDPANPLRLRFASDAQPLFETWFTELELKIRSGDGALFFHLSKYRSLMPSLAGLFELADLVASGSSLEADISISLDHTRQAADLCDYLESHARRVYGAVASSARTAAQELLGHIQKGELDKQFKTRDVYRKGWSGLDSLEKARQALDVLVDFDWIAEVEICRIRGGRRPSETWKVNPRIQEAKRG